MISNLKQLIATWLIRLLPDLINVSRPELVLFVESNPKSPHFGKTFLGGKIISDIDKELVAKDARYLENSKLWKVMTSTLEDDANERIVLKSTTWNDVWAGKMQLYNLSVMKKILIHAKSFAKPEQ